MPDGRQFNVHDSEGRLLCPACGFPGFATQPAYDERGGIIATAICPCCMWEPGFDDVPSASADARETILMSLQHYRARWTDGLLWRGRAEQQPSGWDGAAQLAQLFEIAPNVR